MALGVFLRSLSDIETGDMQRAELAIEQTCDIVVLPARVLMDWGF